MIEKKDHTYGPGHLPGMIQFDDQVKELKPWPVSTKQSIE